MTILKFIAQNRIVGLLPMRRAADGRMTHPEIAASQVVELELDSAEDLVVCGALVPHNPSAYQEAGGRPFNPRADHLERPATGGIVKATPFPG